MPWYGEDEEQQAAERTQFAGQELLLSRLRKAVGRANLGASSGWSLAKQASYSLRLVGAGGSVSVDRPQTIRRAITVLENYKAGAGS